MKGRQPPVLQPIPLRQNRARNATGKLTLVGRSQIIETLKY